MKNSIIFVRKVIKLLNKVSTAPQSMYFTFFLYQNIPNSSSWHQIHNNLATGQQCSN